MTQVQTFYLKNALGQIKRRMRTWSLSIKAETIKPCHGSQNDAQHQDGATDRP